MFLLKDTKLRKKCSNKRSYFLVENLPQKKLPRTIYASSSLPRKKPSKSSNKIANFSMSNLPWRRIPERN